MATLNYALAHPGGVDSAIMLNSAYSEDSTVLWPEMITLFATRSMQALAIAIAQSPEQFGWLLKWQQKKFLDPLPEAQRPHFSAFIGPLISDNFIAQPGAGPAFVQLAAEFFDEHARNAKHLTALKTLDISVKLIWGQYDPYFPSPWPSGVKSQLKNASLTVIPAGHWLQADEPAQVAKRCCHDPHPRQTRGARSPFDQARLLGALVAMLAAIGSAASFAQAAPASSGLDVPTTKLLAIGTFTAKARRNSGSRSFLPRCATPYGSISLGKSTSGTSSRTRAASCS